MGQIVGQKNRGCWIVWTISALLAIALALTTFFFVVSSHSLWEMDWNEDGKYTVTEVVASIDIGKRLVLRDGVPCMQYFSLKDGMEVKLKCKPGPLTAEEMRDLWPKDLVD